MNACGILVAKYALGVQGKAGGKDVPDHQRVAGSKRTRNGGPFHLDNTRHQVGVGLSSREENYSSQQHGGGGEG